MNTDKSTPNSSQKKNGSAVDAQQASAQQQAEAEAAREAQTKPRMGGLDIKDVIAQEAVEDEGPLARHFTLRRILGGDILNTTLIRRQIWVMLLVAFFMIIYISNRYACQQQIIEIDRLQRELQDAKYKALSSKSLITEKSRESNVLEMLKVTKDTTIKIASQPPYIIHVPEGKTTEWQTAEEP